jgi:hypothetical protein
VRKLNMMKILNKAKKIFKKSKLSNTPVIVAVVLFAAVGVYFTFFSQAASNGFYFKTSSNNVTVGKTFDVQVRLNHPTAVDTVQTYINYPANLEVVGSPTVVEPYESDFENNTSSSGLIKIQRSDFSDNLATGDRIITTIKFKAKSAGTASVTFTSDTYGVYQGNKQNLSTNNASYTLSNPASPPPANSPAPSTPSSPTSPTSTSTNENTQQPSGGSTNTTGNQPSGQTGTSTPAPTGNSPDQPVGSGVYTPDDPTGAQNSSQYNAESTAGSGKTSPLVIALSILGVLAVLGAVGELILRKKGLGGIYSYVSSLKTKPTNPVDLPGNSNIASNNITPGSQQTVFKPQTTIETPKVPEATSTGTASPQSIETKKIDS